METKLQQARGELIAYIEKEVRRRGVTNEKTGAIELPCYQPAKHVDINHNMEAVWMCKIVLREATDVATSQKRLVGRLVIETDMDETYAEELYADDLQEIADFITQMTDGDLYECRQWYDNEI